MDITGGEFRDNSAPANTGSGGAIAARNMQQNPFNILMINGTRLVRNSAQWTGGAVHLTSQGFLGLNATFINNSVSVAGGAIYAQDVSPEILKGVLGEDYVYTDYDRAALKVTLVSSNFEGNSAQDGGGALRVQTSALSVVGCNFTANRAGDDFISDPWSDCGGAIGSTACFGYIDIAASKFSSNSATGPGGALCFVSCNAMLKFSKLGNNTAGTQGGAVAAFDRRNNTYTPTPRLTIINSTIGGNIARDGDGGGVYTTDMSVWFVSTNLTNNAAPSGGGGAVAVNKNLETSAEYTRFEGNTAGGTAGGGALLASGAQFVYLSNYMFSSNVAARGSGGAAGLASCGCVIVGGGDWVDNEARVVGGALRLLPANAAGSGKDCIGRALDLVRGSLTPKGRELLGLAYGDRIVYNATVVYATEDGASADGGKLVRAGRMVSVPQATAPLWLEVALRMFAAGTSLDPDRMSTVATQASGIRLHLGTADHLANGEFGRLCAVNFTQQSFGSDAASVSGRFNSSSLKAAIEYFNDTVWANPAPAVAAALYGADPTTTAGYNATLLAPLLWSALNTTIVNALNAANLSAADVLPRSAVPFCYPVMAGPSFMANLSAVLMRVRMVGNKATMDGGGMAIEGGDGQVLLDGLTVRNNTAGGDGGGLAVVPSSNTPGVSAVVHITNTVIESNTAPQGQGGGMVMQADDVATNNANRQTAVYNTNMTGNSALYGGAVGISTGASLMLENVVLSGNMASAEGGGVQATDCSELQLTGSTVVSGNTAGVAGGGLSVSGCGALLLLGSQLINNTAPDGGAAYLVNSYSASAATSGSIAASSALLVSSRASRQRQRVGGMLVVASGVRVEGNRADAENEDGMGGGLMLSGHISSAWDEVTWTNNAASGQGGALMIDSLCDLTPNSPFLLDISSAPTAFKGMTARLPATVASLRTPRPNGCWGTLVLGPSLTKNTAGANGGAMFANFPQALSLACGRRGAAGGAVNDTDLSERVLTANREESTQVVSAANVARCFNPTVSADEERQLRTALDSIANNTRSAIQDGYGPFLGLVPSKLRLTAATWTTAANNASGAGCAAANETASNATTVTMTGSASELLCHPTLESFTAMSVDPKTKQQRKLIGYRLTTLSSHPMDLSVQLLDAMDQVARDGTLNASTPMALVKASLLPGPPVSSADASSRVLQQVATTQQGRCKPEPLGGASTGLAYFGEASLSGLRVRALKGEYVLQLAVSNTRFTGHVEPLNISLVVPPCKVGERPVDGGLLCEPCGSLTFSLWQDTEPLANCTYPDIENITCKPCTLNADCPGGAVVLPVKGAWHSAANSSHAIQCATGVACRADDDDAQQVLLDCQTWWYSRPMGFNYTAYVQSILANDSSAFPEAYGALPDGTYNASDPRLCALWGLPPDHPASYMSKQCGKGYTGNLCGACTTVDGVPYAIDGDLGCASCKPSRAAIVISVFVFIANVLSVAITVLLTFSQDYFEEEIAGAGDILKVLVVHFQFFVIIMGLNIDWPSQLTNLSGIFGTVTGSLSQVSSPGCWKGPDVTPAQQAALTVGYGLLSPLGIVVASVALWLLRYFVWNGVNAPEIQRSENYKEGGGAKQEEEEDAEHGCADVDMVAALQERLRKLEASAANEGAGRESLDRMPRGAEHTDEERLSQKPSRETPAPPSLPPPPLQPVDSLSNTGYGTLPPSMYPKAFSAGRPPLLPSESAALRDRPPAGHTFPSSRSVASGAQPAAGSLRRAPSEANSIAREPRHGGGSKAGSKAPSFARNYSREAASVASSWRKGSRARASGHSNHGVGEGQQEQQEEGGQGGLQVLGLGWARERLTSFFSFGAGDDGKARWVSLQTLDKNMPLSRQCLLVVMIACFVLYPAWAQSVLGIFSCYFLDTGEGDFPEYQLATWHRGYWVFNMNAECYRGEHARVWVPIGAILIVLICAGIPAMGFFIVYYHRNRLHTDYVVQTYGFLYRRYRDGFHYWQTVTQINTLALVVVDTFGRVLPVYQEAMLLQVVLILFFSLSATLEPTKSDRLKSMEFASFAALSATICLALLFVPQLGHANPIGSYSYTGIGALILIVNLAVLVFFVYEMVLESRDTLTPGLERVRGAMGKVSEGVVSVGTVISEASRKLLSFTSSQRRRQTSGGKSTTGGSPQSPRTPSSPTSPTKTAEQGTPEADTPGTDGRPDVAVTEAIDVVVR